MFTFSFCLQKINKQIDQLMQYIFQIKHSLILWFYVNYRPAKLIVISDKMEFSTPASSDKATLI